MTKGFSGLEDEIKNLQELYEIKQKQLDLMHAELKYQYEKIDSFQFAVKGLLNRLYEGPQHTHSINDYPRRMSELHLQELTLLSRDLDF